MSYIEAPSEKHSANSSGQSLVLFSLSASLHCRQITASQCKCEQVRGWHSFIENSVQAAYKPINDSVKIFTSQECSLIMEPINSIYLTNDGRALVLVQL